MAGGHVMWTGEQIADYLHSFWWETAAEIIAAYEPAADDGGGA